MRLLSFLLTATLILGVAVPLLLYAANTPLPRAWNPVKPLHITDPVTPVTGWKLSRASRNGEVCLAALDTGAVTFEPMEDFEASEVCHIRDRVRLSSVGPTALDPVETRCQTALRLALWEEHGLRPLAEDLLGAPLARLDHFSSYSCRPIRTPGGNSDRMSTHARAESIDISGVTLPGGERIPLTSGWEERPELFVGMRDSACDWFGVVLGPDYNRLHADHFHFQNGGWGLCR
ncbi:MAG: extensin family protein [Rubricella sp.]